MKRSEAWARAKLSKWLEQAVEATELHQYLNASRAILNQLSEGSRCFSFAFAALNLAHRSFVAFEIFALAAGGSGPAYGFLANVE
jgi:hypothetical protein